MATVLCRAGWRLAELRLLSKQWGTGAREEQASVHPGWARGPTNSRKGAGRTAGGRRVVRFAAAPTAGPGLGAFSARRNLALLAAPELGVSAGHTWSVRDRGPERRSGLPG